MDWQAGLVGLSEVQFAAAAQPSTPIRIGRMSYENQTVTLWLENCTLGATNEVLRANELGAGAQWEVCTNVVSQVDACSISFPITNAVGSMFFRVRK